MRHELIVFVACLASTGYVEVIFRAKEVGNLSWAISSF
jgi:hypothetical protein